MIIFKVQHGELIPDCQLVPVEPVEIDISKRWLFSVFVSPDVGHGKIRLAVARSQSAVS
jgi:hypothetical protein